MNPSEIQIKDLPNIEISLRSNLPSIPAVYFVIDSQENIQYIGYSQNLQKRWRQHQKLEQIAGFKDLNLAWLTCDDPKTTERDCIEYFKPIHNKVCPGIINRAGKKVVMGFFDPKVCDQFKQLSIEQGRTSQSLFAEALNDLFIKYGYPLKAT